MKLNDEEVELGHYMSEFPMHHSVPIYFGNPDKADSSINNGTATLLKRNNKLYVATNHHVINEFLARQSVDSGVSLQIGGLYVENITSHIILDDEDIDICILEFSSCTEEDFYMYGNVHTRFYELGEIKQSLNVGSVVAFGGYPGVFRTQYANNRLNFHTLSSGASVVIDRSDRNIIVSIDHDESGITALSSVAPPSNIGGMSGGPVFEINKVGEILTFSFGGIIAECNENLKIMRVKPVSLFIRAFL